MRFLLQKVTNGSVSWGDERSNTIGVGLVVFVGIGRGDQSADVEYLVQKTLSLRVFRDPIDEKEVSIQDIRGDLLVISQFTLYADTRKGRRPSYGNAESPELAEQLFGQVVKRFEGSNLAVQTGKFGAEMTVTLSNDGPYTIMLESASDNW